MYICEGNCTELPQSYVQYCSSISGNSNYIGFCLAQASRQQQKRKCKWHTSQFVSAIKTISLPGRSLAGNLSLNVYCTNYRIRASLVFRAAAKQVMEVSVYAGN